MSPPYKYHSTKKTSANAGCYANDRAGNLVYLKTFYTKKRDRQRNPIENKGSAVAEVVSSHLRVFLDEECFGVQKGESKVIKYNFVQNNEGNLRLESKVLGGLRSEGEKGPDTDSKKYFIPLWELAGFKSKPKGVFVKDRIKTQVKQLLTKLSKPEKDQLSQDLITNWWMGNRDPNFGNTGRFKGCLWFLDQGHSLKNLGKPVDKIDDELRDQALKGEPTNNLRVYGVNRYELFLSDAAKERVRKIEGLQSRESKKKIAKHIRESLRECEKSVGLEGIKEFAEFSGCNLNDKDKQKVLEHFKGDKKRGDENNPEFWIQLVSMQMTNNLVERSKQMQRELTELEVRQILKGTSKADLCIAAIPGRKSQSRLVK